MKFEISAIALVVVATACSSGAERVTPQRAKLQVNIEPGDLSTSVRGSPIQALVGFTTLDVPSEPLAELATRLSLVSDAGETVQVLVRIEPPSAGTPGVRSIALIPSAELKSSWHEVHVDLRGTNIDPHPSLESLGDGTFFARFHPDSSPVVQAVSYCRVEDKASGTAAIEFSEPIDFVPTAANVGGEVPVALSIDSVSCKMIETVRYMNAEDEANASNFNSHFEFRCSGLGESPRVLVVSLVRSLTAASGATAVFLGSDTGPSSTALSFANSYDIGSGCTAWNLP